MLHSPKSTVNVGDRASQPSFIREVIGRMAAATRPAFKKMEKEVFRLVPSRMPSATNATITSTTNHFYVFPPTVPSGEFALLPDQPMTDLGQRAEVSLLGRPQQTPTQPSLVSPRWSISGAVPDRRSTITVRTDGDYWLYLSPLQDVDAPNDLYPVTCQHCQRLCTILPSSHTRPPIDERAVPAYNLPPPYARKHRHSPLDLHSYAAPPSSATLSIARRAVTPRFASPLSGDPARHRSTTLISNPLHTHCPP